MEKLTIAFLPATSIMESRKEINSMFRKIYYDEKRRMCMGHVIAVAGKGGVGKTTLCGLLIQYLCESGKKPVLAVDADANSNLNEVLGVEIGPTLGELREEIERAGSDPKYEIPKGITKSDWLEDADDGRRDRGGGL